MNPFKILKQIGILTILCVCTISNAQSHYGDLELTILTDNTIPAQFVDVKAIDPDLADTTTATTNANGVAYFQDLYIYTSTGINKPSNNTNKKQSLEGVVSFFNLNGQLIDQRPAQNGSVLWNGNDRTPSGVYIARDEANNVLKFLYMQQATRIGQFTERDNSVSHKNTVIKDTSNMYILEADGTTIEFNPFNITTEEFEMKVGFNEHLMTPVSVPDAPSMGQLEILVDGLPCNDGSLIRLVRPGETDTTYLNTTNGISVFDATAGVTSHPFGNFTREYLALISGDNFLSETNSVQMALGSGNNFTFNPSSLPLATGFVRIWEENFLVPNVETNMWRLINPADTAHYVTNAVGKFMYTNIPVSGPTDYVFQSFKDDGVNPVLVSMDTATLVGGENPLLNFYLEQIPQFFRLEGQVREFYAQSQVVQGRVMQIRDRESQEVIASSTTDANGMYSLANIPAGLEGEIVMFGGANHFNRINDYNLPEILQSLEDTLISDINTLHVPYDFIIPQTANDPAPATLVAVALEVAEMARGDEKNGEEIARFENRIHLTNFGIPPDSAFYHSTEQVIDSLFYGGQGSPLVLVPNQINIGSYHQQNYDVFVGFPNQLGWNVTRGNGDVTTPIYSTPATGNYILGGQINITSSQGAIKELQGRRLQLGSTSFPSFMNNGDPSDPTHKDRAYVHAILINHDARVMQSYEVFPLSGLSTTTQRANRR